ncbi:hypothetical protein Vadar_031334 [Vaccinium darrowii]|uniref:Uncharacterized protein n=1 Tax=Vaccinium darrowii TaxID=229202 RepID=A0ACB7XW29_9ERIC|nr:hypothetical protein Vadar_031334 [Vaccinium darrowii]
MVVHFTTGRWGSYHQVGSLLDLIAKKKPDVIYVKIIIDTLKSVAEEWAMETLPTVVFIKEGKVVDKIVGGEQYVVWSAVVKHSSSATQDFWWGGLTKCGWQ